MVVGPCEKSFEMEVVRDCIRRTIVSIERQRGHFTYTLEDRRKPSNRSNSIFAIISDENERKLFSSLGNLPIRFSSAQTHCGRLSTFVRRSRSLETLETDRAGVAPLRSRTFTRRVTSARAPSGRAQKYVHIRRHQNELK